MDKLVQGIAAGGDIRVFGAITTSTVAEAIRRHQTSPTVSAALGRTMTGALMMASTLKELDRLTVKIEAEGPVGGITAEANADGKVRGYVKNPVTELPANGRGKFDVSGIIGKGMFYVIREAGFDIGFRPEPYVGSVPIVSGEIAEDFAYYLAKSEQIPSAVMLGVLLNNHEPYVAASGGVMIQMMPGANEHLITMIEDTIAHAPHLTTVINAETRPEQLIEIALGEIAFEILGEKEVAFECTCSFDKAITMVEALGRDEVASMLAEQGGATMNCGFCNEVYSLDAAALSGMLKG
ncbi:MAG TPA: Hsp33 family molecular chaperone HslO [Pyrinomonadaceae bacterium]|nr:Hsp33 family molecular chaperone HslO [Pyrinomonadaceae bacterium]